MGIADFQSSSLNSGTSGGFLQSNNAQSDLNTSAGLLQLAQQQGGAVSEAANELVHPTTSILSTMSDAFKHAFGGFVDLISIPSEIVAGALDPNKSIGEAIDQHERVSDVVFGNRNPNASTVQKVGDFFVRTAVDILTDPLTYLTFGASQGIFGLKSFESISLGAKGAEAIGAGADGTEVITKSVSKQGQAGLNYLNLVKKQMSGTLGLETAITEAAAKAGTVTLEDGRVVSLAETAGRQFKDLATQNALDVNTQFNKGITDFTSDEFKTLLKNTIDAPLNVDFAKRALSNIIENNPALTQTLLDKGGVKAFGQTILSGQRIGTIMRMVPGMSALDTLTTPTRMALGALFNPAIEKSGNQYIRIPEEMVQFKQQAKDFAEASGIDSVTALSNVIRENTLSKNELDQVMAAITATKLPADSRLANGYMQLMNLKAENKAFIEARGGHISTMEQHTGNVAVPTDIRKISYAGKASGSIGAAQTATNAKFIAQTGQDVAKEVPTIESTLTKLPGGQQLVADIKNTQSVQDAGFALGRHTDEYLKHLTSGGVSTEEAFKDKGLQDLIKMRQQIDSLPQSKQLIGSAESHGLKMKLTEDEQKRIIDGLNEFTAKQTGKVNDLHEDIGRLAEVVQGIFSGKLLNETKTVLSKASGLSDRGDLLTDGKNIPGPLHLNPDKGNLSAFVDHVMAHVPAIDVQKLAESYAAKKSAQEVSVASLKGMTPEGLKGLMEKMIKGHVQLPADVEAFNNALREAVTTVKTDAKAAGKVDGSPELSKMADQIKEASKNGRFAFAQEHGDIGAITQFVDGVKKAFEQDPTGAGKALSSILGKNQKIADVLEGIKTETTAAKQELSKLPELDRFFVNNEGTIFKRVGASANELKDSGIEGFDTNLATSMATRFVQNINQGISHEFLQNFGRFFGKNEKEAGHGWVELSLPKAVEGAEKLMSSAGDRILFHPAMAAAAEDMFKSLTTDPATSDFLKAFDKIQQYWKASVTAVFPAFHGRNAISNVLLNFLDLGYHAFNPATHMAAADLLNKDRQANNLARVMMGSGADAVAAKESYQTLMNTHIYTDALGGTYTFGELRQAIKTRGVAFSRNQLGQLDFYGDRERLFSQLAPYSKSTAKKAIGLVNPLNTETFAPTKYGMKVGNMIESQARIVNFLSNLKATGDVAHAAQRTKQFLFDYTNMTQFEKTVMRRLMPFYTFTRKNLELQMDTLLTTPGRIAGQITALGTLGDTLSGGNLTPAEQAALPGWVKSGIGVLASKKGETVSILTGFGTPIEQPFQQFQPNQLLGSMSPLVRLPLEQASGYSFFQGKPLSDVTNAAAFKDAPQALKDLIGFTTIHGKRTDGTPFTWYTSLHPEMMNLVLNLPPTTRVFGALKQMEATDISNQYKILQQTVGIKPYSFDLDQEAQKRENELKAKLQTLLTNAGVTAQFTRTFIPKAKPSF